MNGVRVFCRQENPSVSGYLCFCGQHHNFMMMTISRAVTQRFGWYIWAYRMGLWEGRPWIGRIGLDRIVCWMLARSRLWPNCCIHWMKEIWNRIPPSQGLGLRMGIIISCRLELKLKLGIRIRNRMGIGIGIGIGIRTMTGFGWIYINSEYNLSHFLGGRMAKWNGWPVIISIMAIV